MRFHFGLGVGHVYSHDTEKYLCSTQGAPRLPTTQAGHGYLEREEGLWDTTNGEAPGNGEEGEEGEHIAVEELNHFQQEQNGSTESLIDALDEMFSTDHAFDYEN